MISKLSSYLKPGGKLLLRDYGRYDEAQLRFKSNSRLTENQYVRQDGTLTYYFSKDDLYNIAQNTIITLPLPLSYNNNNNVAGNSEEGQENISIADRHQQQKQYSLQVLENEYVMRQYANRQQKVARYRVWIQAKFQLQEIKPQ